MSLCQPVAREVDEPSDLWVEEQRSDFLLLQRATRPLPAGQAPFRVLLLHNEIIVALARDPSEKEKIWKISNSISQVARSGTPLLNTFLSVWQEENESEAEPPLRQAIRTTEWKAARVPRKKAQSMLLPSDHAHAHGHSLPAIPTLSAIPPGSPARTPMPLRMSAESVQGNASRLHRAKRYSSRFSFSLHENYVAVQLFEKFDEQRQRLEQSRACSQKGGAEAREEPAVPHEYAHLLMMEPLFAHALLDCDGAEEGFVRFHKDDLLLILSHPQPHLLFVQTLSEFGVTSKAFVEVMGNQIDPSSPLRPTVRPDSPAPTSPDNGPVAPPVRDRRGSMGELARILCATPNLDTLTGWLFKRGWWLNREWKRRWFSLDLSSGRMYYSVSPEAQEGQNHRGFIELNQVTTVHESFTPDSHALRGGWAFEIHTPQRVWLLSATRKQEMDMWIHQINQYALLMDHRREQRSSFHLEHRAKVLEGDVHLTTGTVTPGARSHSAHTHTLHLPTNTSEIMALRKEALYVSEKKAAPAPVYPPDDFSHFGAPDGEEITNKATLLTQLDRWLGHREPPSVEYIYVEPYLNYAAGKVMLTANPYGHAVVRYTLPDTKEQLLMNIVGLAEHELVNFLSPEDFFFSTNFDTKIGNEQGGIYNRNFASVRIQRVPPEKILAMHQYFLDLHSRSRTDWAGYNILLGPLLNRASTVSYGNCAHWASQGLLQAGLMERTSMFPKAIWQELFENLLVHSQQEYLSNNVSVVYYKRVLHAKRFYGQDADWAGWGRPTDYFGTKYDQLELWADAIVSVPAHSKTATLAYGPKSRMAEREASMAARKAQGLSTVEVRFDFHVKPRVLFNECFYKRYHIRTLQEEPLVQLDASAERAYRLLACGMPLEEHVWRVDHDHQLYRTVRTEGELVWRRVEAPGDDGGYSCLTAGEDGSCWVVYEEALYYREDAACTWVHVTRPSSMAEILQISLVTMEEGVFVLDTHARLYQYHTTTSSWTRLPDTPPQLRFISVGTKGELWGLTENDSVYRRVFSERYPQGCWIQLHGALLRSIAVASPEEVWGVDAEGRAYVWNAERVVDDFTELDTNESEEEARERSWQSLGNVLPLAHIHVHSQGTPWGLSDIDPDHIYQLSTHRLLVVSVQSARKIWDDRNTKCAPFHVGFYRPVAPRHFYPLGDVAERSHLHNLSNEAIVVCEVGRARGAKAILMPPRSFELLWHFKGSSSHYDDCYVWRAVPHERYVALGHVVTTTATPPELNCMRCVHRRFLNRSKHCTISQPHGYLWSNERMAGGRSDRVVSVWLVKPRLDSIWCNVFQSVSGAHPPPSQRMQCLKLAAPRSSRSVASSSSRLLSRGDDHPPAPSADESQCPSECDDK